MATSALSFAEMLRDEYFYLHGHVPRLRATVEEKHLREVSQLALRLATAPMPAPRTRILTRHSLLKPYFLKAHGEHDRQRLKNAFTKLLEDECLEIGEGADAEPLTLFAALLRDPELSDDESPLCLRRHEVLRKLVAIPRARKILFTDRRSARLVASNDELVSVFRAQSAAIRLMEATPNGGALLREYPPLLATIADNRRIERLLSTRRGAKERREKLIAYLISARRKMTWYFEVLPTPRDRFASADGWETACDPEAVERVMAIPDDRPLPHANRAIPRDPLTMFNSVLLEAAFVECFTDSYDVRSVNSACHNHNTAALCLSGGGIRSATFNLGVLQGLADHGLLTKFHYLSTVSGGGYIGSCLSSWIRRHPDGVRGVAEDLCAPPADPEEPEVRPIKHLREYSSYLAPRAAASTRPRGRRRERMRTVAVRRRSRLRWRCRTSAATPAHCHGRSGWHSTPSAATPRRCRTRLPIRSAARARPS
jgi:hypothetical protein